MKLLILACLLGLSAASFLQEAAPVIDNAVMSFGYGASKAGSLSDALGIYDPIIDQIEDDTKTELGRILREQLNKILERIKKEIEDKKKVANEFLEKLKELKDKLKDLNMGIGEKAKELLEKLKEKTKDKLKELLERMFDLGKRSLNDEYDQVARMKFRDIVEKIKEKILENIQKIKEYFKNLVTDNPIIKKLKEFFEKLRDADLREILHHLLEYRPGKQQRAISWDKIKEWFKEKHIELKEHFKKMGEWVMDMWGKGLDKLKEKHGFIKAIAMEMIEHAKDMHEEVKREMLEYLRPYKEDLGSLWQLVVDAVKERIGS